MKKPIEPNSSSPSSRTVYAADMKRYEAFLVVKAAKNKAYRANRTQREKDAVAKAHSLQANRVLDPTREEWLMRAAQAILAHLAPLGYTPTGDVKVSLGFPSGGHRKKNKALGECWSDECSPKGYREIFIHPEVTDTERLLGILTHELGHACLPFGTGHRAPFKRFCEAVGFEFKKPEFAIEGPAFWGWARHVGDDLGTMPHAGLSALPGKDKKQGTRMLKIECPCCGFKFRAARTPLLAIAETDSAGPYVRCPSPNCMDIPKGAKAESGPATRIYLDMETDLDAGDEEE